MRQFHARLAPVCVVALGALGNTSSPANPSLVSLNTLAITTFLTPIIPADACNFFARNNWVVKKLTGELRLGGSPVRAMKFCTAFCRATGSGNCEANNVSRYPAVLVVAGTRNSERVVVTVWL